MNNETNANEINDDIVTERRIYNMDMKNMAQTKSRMRYLNHKQSTSNLKYHKADIFEKKREN
jgi:hypothetical protein